MTRGSSERDPRGRRLGERMASSSAAISRLQVNLGDALAADRAVPEGRAGALACPECGAQLAAWGDDGEAVLLTCSDCGRCEFRHHNVDDGNPWAFRDQAFAGMVAEFNAAGTTKKRKAKLAKRINRWASQLERPGARPPLRRADQPLPDHNGRPTLPTWEGVHSMRDAWDACQYVVDRAPLVGEGTVKEGGDVHGGPGARVEVISGAEAFCLQALFALSVAHPVWIGPQQLGALPDDVDALELVRWGRDTTLPFPTMYLDFTSSTGPAAIDVPMVDHQLLLYGAVVFDAHGSPPEANVSTNGLTIIPMGAGMRFPKGDVQTAGWGEGRGMPAAAPLGAYGVSTIPPPVSDCVTGDMGVGGGRRRWVKGTSVLMGRVRGDDLLVNEPADRPVDDLGLVMGGGGGVLSALCDERGGVFTVAGRSESELDLGRRADTMLVVELEVVLTASLQALKALYLLDSANVELEEAPVSRPVRRQAARKGYSIAKVVRVKLGHRRASRPSAHPSKRNYTHRFDRRGYYRHVTRGSHMREPFIKPCARDDEAHRDTGGKCRREWVPPTVVGDEELPYVPKARIWQADQQQEDAT